MFLFFLAFSQLNLSVTFELTTFPFSLLKVSSLLSSIWTVKYCTKTWHFKILISFLLYYYFFSLSYCLLPTWALFIIVLHNGVKKTFTWERCDLWHGIGTEMWLVTCARARSLVVSNLRWETKGSRFESGC